MADSDDESGGHNSNAALNCEYSSREQDRFLPIANVSRIMKKALPANAKISKVAMKTVQECISEFISSITEEASNKCQREKRDTINGDDLLWALTTLGFTEYVEPLKIYLQKLRELEGEEGVGSSHTQRDAGRGNGGAGGSGMMMGQQIYESPPPSSYHQNHHNQTTMDGGVDRSSSSSTTTTDGSHGRI